MGQTKKTLIIVIVSATVAAMVFAVCLAFSVFQKYDKMQPVNKEEFIKAAQNWGYEVSDISEQAQEGVKVLLYGTYGEPADGAEVNYFLYDSQASARGGLESLINLIDTKYKNGSQSNSRISFGKYSKYQLNSNGMSYFAIRVDDTVVYLAGPKSDEERIKGLLLEIKY